MKLHEYAFTVLTAIVAVLTILAELAMRDSLCVYTADHVRHCVVLVVR